MEVKKCKRIKRPKKILHKALYNKKMKVQI